MSDDESVKIAAFLEKYFGGEFRKIYSILKQQEMDKFDRTVTPLEYGTHL